VLVAGLLGALVLAGWAGVARLVGGTGDRLGPSRPIVARVVVVRPGDTLWSIALRCGATGDIRPLVDRLDAEVHGQPIYPGEQITIP
jgi:hypothetical protein